MAITTMDGLVSALASGTKIDFYKTSATAEGAATWHSLWNVTAIPPAGSTPANLSGIVCTYTTSGSFTAGMSWANTSYLAQVVLSGATAGKVIIYDRLWHNGNMKADTSVSGAGAAVSVCTTNDITRPNSNGTAVEMWGEIYSPIGATGATLNVIYENDNGISGRTATYVHPANAESLGQMFPITLQAGDTGVKRVHSYYWSATTATTGNFGIVLMRRLAEVPIWLINQGFTMDFAALGLPTVYDNAMLQMMVLCTTTSTGIIQGSMRIVQG